MLTDLQYYFNYLIDTDGALNGFATGCAAAGKDGCALVKYDNTTSTDILARIQGLLDVRAASRCLSTSLTYKTPSALTTSRKPTST